MAVNWGLGVQQGPDPGQRFQQAFDAGVQRQDQQALRGFQQEQMRDRRATRAAGVAAGQRIAAGDYQGAITAAAPSGDLDLIRAISTMSNEQRAQTRARNQAITPLRMQARQLPYEQRRAFIASVAPRLQSEFGMTPEQIAAYDPTDQQLDSDITLGMTVEQQLARNTVNWEGVAGGEQFATDNLGRPLPPGDPRLMANAPQGAQPPAQPVPGAPASPQPPQAQPPVATPTGAPRGGFDAFYNGFLAPAEGGYVASDGRSGAPANFGVNQRANPDVDVRNLTQAQARQIMHDRYWVPSGADRIQNPGLQAVHADTAVNMGVGAAQGLLQQANGDPQRYLQLREDRYRQIGGPDLPGWLNRNQQLASFISGGQQGGQLGAPQSPPPNIQTQAMTGRIPRPAPPGYQNTQQGTLQAIPGGPGDQTYSRSRDTVTDARQNRTEIAQVRQQYRQDPEIRQFRQVRIATRQIGRLAASADAASDMGLIFSFMRALDPTSTVREGEFATAQNAAGWDDRFRNAYNNAREGTRLSPSQRMGMTRTAIQLYLSRAESYNEIARQYRDDFQALGMSEQELGRTVPLATGPSIERQRQQQRPQQQGRGRTTQNVRWRRVD